MSQKILIVDDDAELLRLIGMTLHRAGYSPVAAHNAQVALEKIESEQPALVILDVMLPGASGIEICRALRSHSRTALLPIIMLSARTQVEDKIEGLEAGADEYLTKPISPKELVARVAALLERTERLRQGQGPSGRVLGFMGVKGGVGTTTLTLNVGATMAQQGYRVIVAELRPDYGTFDIHLGHKPQERLSNLWERAGGRLGKQVVRTSLLSDSSGMEVLYGPESPDVWPEEVAPDDVAALITTLTQMADYVLLDLPCSASAMTKMALKNCDWITLVTRPEADSLAATSVVLNGLKQWGISSGIVEVVVVNQAPLAMGLSVSQAAEQVGCNVPAIIPAAADACAAAVKRGRPLVVSHPENPTATRIRELGAYLAEKE